MGYLVTKQAPPSESPKPDTAVVTVSIVVPMYCCEEYVPELMEDLLSQEFEDMEILCIIDGSPDETLQRVETYARTDNRIRVFYQEHGGAGTARNYGLSLARGKYIMFLDADDRYSPIFVSRMVQAIEESEADIATCYFQVQNSWSGNTIDKMGFSRSLLPRGKVVYPSQIPYLLQSFSPMVHNKIYRKNFISSHDLHFSATSIVNDIFFVMASLVCAEKIALVPETLYSYRAHHNTRSITSNRSFYQLDLFTVYEDLYQWLKARNHADFYRVSYCQRWRNTFHSMARFGINKDFQHACVRFLMEHEPWCDMPEKHLYRMAGLSTESAEMHRKIHQRKLKNWQSVPPPMKLPIGKSDNEKVKLKTYRKFESN